jgi:hypothetical protein
VSCAEQAVGAAPHDLPAAGENEVVESPMSHAKQGRGLTPKQASDIVNSFEGQILARKGTIGEVFVITEAKPGAASAVFVTRDFAGATPGDRVRQLALPPTNSAEFEGLVELSRDQILLEGRVAAQPQWGADKTGGGWQTVTDGGRYTGAVRRLI